MSPVVIILVVSGVVVLALLALGTGLVLALRSAADAVVALEQRLADIEGKSAEMRETLASVDGDLAAMASHLATERRPLETSPTSPPSSDQTSTLPTRGRQQ